MIDHVVVERSSGDVERDWDLIDVSFVFGMLRCHLMQRETGLCKSPRWTMMSEWVSEHGVGDEYADFVRVERAMEVAMRTARTEMRGESDD